MAKIKVGEVAKTVIQGKEVPVTVTGVMGRSVRVKFRIVDIDDKCTDETITSEVTVLDTAISGA